MEPETIYFENTFPNNVKDETLLEAKAKWRGMEENKHHIATTKDYTEVVKAVTGTSRTERMKA